jgi:hypothetical protein
MQEINYHFFVSYTTREEEVSIINSFVDTFIEIFRKSGANISASPIFYDFLSIGDGPKTPDKLRNLLIKGVRESVCMIAFVSDGYLSSPWCLFEWSMMDAVQIYRGPNFSAILPVKWKKIDNPAFIETRDYIQIGPPKPKENNGFGREVDRWVWNPSDFEVCIFRTIEFVKRRIEELREFKNLEFRLTSFDRIATEVKDNTARLFNYPDQRYEYLFI